MAQTIWDEPTAEQAALVAGVLAGRGEDGTWPTVARLAERLPGVDVRAVVHSFPAAATPAGTRYRAVWCGTGTGGSDGGGGDGTGGDGRDRVGLTLAAGLLTLDYEIAPYLAMIRTCANRVASAGAVTMSSGRFLRQFGADHALHVRTFPAVLQREPLAGSIEARSDGDGWSIAFGAGFAAYAGVRHLKDYVRKTVDGPAAPAERTAYVDPALLRGLAATRHPARERLHAVLSELNSNYEAGHPYATVLLHRAVTAGSTEVLGMADVPPPGSLDALIRAIVERG